MGCWQDDMSYYMKIIWNEACHKIDIQYMLIIVIFQQGFFFF